MKILTTSVHVYNITDNHCTC